MHNCKWLTHVHSLFIATLESKGIAVALTLFIVLIWNLEYVMLTYFNGVSLADRKWRILESFVIF